MDTNNNNDDFKTSPDESVENLSAEDILKLYSEIIEVPDENIIAGACYGGPSYCIYSGYAK